MLLKVLFHLFMTAITGGAWLVVLAIVWFVKNA